MKNLRLYLAESTNGLESIESTIKEALCFCIDSLNGLSYFALSEKIFALDIEMKLVNEIFWSNEWDTSTENLILFDFLFDESQLCAIFDTGKVLLIDTRDGQISEMPSIPGQIRGGAWSPDLQALVLASDDMLYLLSREFEIISEEVINPTIQGKDQLLTVGWGSRESQFQGTGTLKKREAADLNRMPSLLLPYDDRKVLISWRSDAQFFTVSSIIKHDEIPGETMESRRLRVWNRELELMSHCDWLSGIENVLTMRSQGNLIATTRIFNNERWIWFFERNGQYRYKFCVGPVNNSTVRHISWNFDSSVLAIVVEASNDSEVQFWTVSNYDWSKKLVVKTLSKIVDSKWDNENTHCYHFYTAAGHYRRIYLERMYDTENLSAINVNGNKLRITDLFLAPIPPPMSHYELALASSITALCQHDNLLFVLLDDQTLSIYEIDNRKYTCKNTMRISGLEDSDILYNIQYVSSNCISALCKSREYKIVTISLVDQKITDVFCTNKPITWHKFIDNDLGYIAQLNDGVFLSISKGKDTKPLEIDGSIIQTRSVNCHKCWYINNHGVLILLNRNHQFYINGRLVHSSIGSLNVNERFVIVTTLSNELYCLPTNELKTLQAKDFDRLEGRVVERGACIVESELNGTRVWLQMPRGNFETIHPRFLLINRLKTLLDQLEFEKAIKEMRRHRIDNNLIYDHNPQLFLENVKPFVDQINDAELLNLFILSLYDEDSTTKIFASIYMNRTPDRSGNENKVNRVCNSLLNYILALEWDKLKKLYSTALYCFIKMKPSKISEALSDIKIRYSYANGQGEDLLREWLRHLSYLCDERLLFNKALKTYDLHVALLVAEACNKDPKEYLPLLRDLQKISPPAYQRYHIDLKLDPPDVASALEHLAEVDEKFDECLQHIKKHRLYSKALAVFYNKPQFKDICRLCAENLLSLKRYDEATLLFRKCDDLNNVLKCHELGKNYNGYIEVSTIVCTPVDVIQKTLERMALSFEATDDFAKVAEIYTLLNNEKYYSKIIENFGKALYWNKALGVAVKDNKYIDQLKTIVENRFNNLLPFISTKKSEIENYLQRLEIVRTNKMKQLQEWVDAEGDLDIAQSETMSEASTTISNLSKISKMSTVSSRRRKNIEKKKKVLKEGSPYEDAAILGALKEIYASLLKHQDELKELLQVMVALDLINGARKLQSESLLLLTFASQSIKTAWPNYIQLKSLIGPIYEIYRGEDGIVRMPSEDGIMPSRIPLDDELIPPRFSCDPSWQMEILK